jgi:hypothetical protein
MARSRPCGRFKSDHRVCQAARFARAADHRERISLSAERQEILIAAVNAGSDDALAPRRRRSPTSKGLKDAGQPARKVSRGRRFSAADQKAKRQDPRVLESCAAERGEQKADCLLLQMPTLKFRGSLIAGPASRCIKAHSVFFFSNQQDIRFIEHTTVSGKECSLEL